MQSQARREREGGRERERERNTKYLDRSYPAERAEAREGKTAFGESFLTLSKGESFAILGEGSGAWSDTVVPLDAIVVKVPEERVIDFKGRRERFGKNLERLKSGEEQLARIVPAMYLPCCIFPPVYHNHLVLPSYINLWLGVVYKSLNLIPGSIGSLKNLVFIGSS
jgi:hypothetical protein